MSTSLALIFNFHKGAGSVNVFGASVQTGDFWAFVIGFLLVAICLSLLGILTFKNKPIQIGNSELSLSKQSYILVSIIAIVMFSSFVFFRSTNAYASPNHFDPTIAEDVYAIDAYVNEDTGEVTVDDWLVKNQENFNSLLIQECAIMAADGLEGIDGNIQIGKGPDEIYNGPFCSLSYPRTYVQNEERVSIAMSFKNPEVAKSLIDKDNVFLAKLSFEEANKPSPEDDLNVMINTQNTSYSDNAKSILTADGWTFDPSNNCISKYFKFNTPVEKVYEELNPLIESGDITSSDATCPKFSSFVGNPNNYITYNNYLIFMLWVEADYTPEIIIDLGENSSFSLNEKGIQVAAQNNWVYERTENTLTKSTGIGINDRLFDLIKIWTPDTLNNTDPTIGFDYWACDYDPGVPIPYYLKMSAFDDSMRVYIVTYSKEEQLNPSEQSQKDTAATDVSEAAIVAEAPAAEAVAADEAVAVDAGEAIDVLDKAAEAVAEIANVDIAEASGVLLSVIIFFLF